MKCKVCVLRARGFLYISVGANAILVTVLVILYISQNHIIRKNNDLTQTSERRKAEYQTGHSDVRVSVEDDTVCLGCDYLGKDVTVEQTLYSNMTYSDCGARLCCLRDRGIARLLRQMLNMEESDSHHDDLKSLSWWRKRPNSAHLYLKDWDRSRLHWTDRDRTGSAFSNLEIKDSNKLIIKEQGTYFVYAAILFEFGLIDKVPQVYYNISSYFPPVPNFPPFLVMGKYGGSKFSDRRHTGYLSGIVELYQGHQISVSVNDHRFIDSSPYGNYFGLIKL
ncbi:uncharacterized protein LOC125658295 [Ostrea edulis]|uniref:uncharacterized protein LOC125658295 n=1 Tax=Ostrea edulis TaxID=37623 RepID=UPI0024AF1AC9|nr:uncharacterized protein LOC125658295 [Ostrea edulis]